MSRGVADNRDPHDANLPTQSGPITSQGRPNGSSTHPPPSAEMLAASPSTVTANGNVASTSFQPANDFRDRSPGPHLEEMTNGDNDIEFLDVDDMNRFIRFNGEDTGSGQSSSGSQDSNEVFDADLRRVKVYELVGSRWTDRGTAFCSGEYDHDTEEARLTARAEGTGDVIMSCLVRQTDVYQRQADTLIVWTEPDGTDFALSFQDMEGCSEVWEFITEVQSHLVSRGTPPWTYDPNIYPVFEGGGDSPTMPPVVSDFDYDSHNLFDHRNSLKDPDSYLPTVPSTAAQIIRSGHLPPPRPDGTFIAEIEKALRTMARMPKSRETICTYIQDNRYIHQLLDAFEAAEKMENLDALHALCSCMQTILLLNEHTMYEHILTDELWLGVVGMLEYDPEFPRFKANYREFLLQRSHFIQPIPIEDAGIHRKIHATYRLQYLKDVILGRALDDSTFNVLNSCIIFNQIDIIGHVQRDERFLTELASLFARPIIIQVARQREREREREGDMEVDKPPPPSPPPINVISHFVALSTSPGTDESADVERRKAVISLLQQLCVMGKNVQLPTRITLFRTLVEKGVLYAIQWALGRSEKQLVFMAGEILAVLLDHHIISVRSHVLSQAIALAQPTGDNEGRANNNEQAKAAEAAKDGPPPFKETLSQVLCRMMANSQDLALQTQLADSLRLLVDVPPLEPPPPPQLPPHIQQAQGIAPPVPIPNPIMNRPFRDDLNTERFLDNFYKVCIESLMRPLTHEVPDHHELKTDAAFTLSREKGNLYLYLCDLLCSFAMQHSFRSFFFILSSNVVSRVASLLSVRDKHLSLAALRFFRICLKMKNHNLLQHMDKHDCFTPICRLTVQEAKRENLLSSTCQEFFEFMRRENLRDAINYVMQKHEAEMRELADSAHGSSTFRTFVARWEINKEPLPPETEPEKKPPIAIPRIPGQRVMESAEEDSYFHGDDNEDDPVVPVPRVDSFLGLFRRKRQRISVPGPHAQISKAQRLVNVASHHRPISPLSSLLEYEDDDDSSSPVSDQVRSDKEPSTPQSPILPHRQIQILPYEPSEHEPSDPEDELLESLLARTPDEQVAGHAKLPLSTLPEKRRRVEEEDDAFERLTPKNRRLSNASVEASQVAAVKARAGVAGIQAEAGEESGGPKKLKLKFNASKPLAAAKPDIPAKRDSKDGGNG